MDHAAFCYSPIAPGEPVLQQVIDSHLFINVAEPQAIIPPTVANGPMEIKVNKAHLIGFDAGRTVTIMTSSQGDFVEVVGDSDQDDSLVLPQGASLKQIELTQPWIVPLPTPTQTWFWMGEAMRSFQGPVTLPVTG